MMNRNNLGQNISVVMISLNEELAISRVISDIQQCLPEAEIIVVDSSTDNTATIAESLGCTVFRQLPPQGYGRAMDKAFQLASHDIIVTLDCDSTYPISAIPKLVSLINEGYDLVSGTRLKTKPKNMPFENYLANRFFTFVARLICGVHSTDLHTGMRAYRKKLLSALPYNANAPALPVELQIAAIRLGYRCTEIPIDYFIRLGSSKLHRFSSTLWTIKRLWRWRFFFNSQKK